MKSLLNRYLESTSKRVDTVLDRLLAPKPEEPAEIRKAMRYSIFAGGKRLRPGLVAAGAECCAWRSASRGEVGRAWQLEISLADGSTYSLP